MAPSLFSTHGGMCPSAWHAHSSLIVLTSCRFSSERQGEPNLLLIARPRPLLLCEVRGSSQPSLSVGLQGMEPRDTARLPKILFTKLRPKILTLLALSNPLLRTGLWPDLRFGMRACVRGCRTMNEWKKAIRFRFERVWERVRGVGDGR